MNVLVADDTKFTKIIFKHIMQTLGHKCVLVNNGQEAFEAVKNIDFDLIFMDIEMPILSGVEATEKIRNELPAPKNTIPIIAITAYNGREFFARLVNSGFTDYLSKRFNSQSITEIIEKHCSKILPNQAEQINGLNFKKYKLNFFADAENINDSLKLELVKHLVEFIPELIQELKISYNQSAWNDVKKICHKLGSQLHYIGLKNAEELSDQIEFFNFNHTDFKQIVDWIEIIEKDSQEAILEMKKDFKIE